MPGILNDLFGHYRNAGDPIPEGVQQPPFDAVVAHEAGQVRIPEQPVLDRLAAQEAAIADVANAQANLNHVRFGENQWPAQQQAAPMYWHGQYAEYQAPPPMWEIRQQIYPQPIETRLSNEDIEKLAQRILVLIEEREAE